MSSNSPITVSISFEKRPVTGIQLAALVQQISTEDGISFTVQDQRTLIGFGQESQYPEKNTRVVPVEALTVQEAFFAPDETYPTARVIPYIWGEVLLYGYGRDAVIARVNKVAADLTTAYEAALADGFPEYVKPDDDWL